MRWRLAGAALVVGMLLVAPASSALSLRDQTLAAAGTHTAISGISHTALQGEAITDCVPNASLVSTAIPPHDLTASSTLTVTASLTGSSLITNTFSVTDTHTVSTTHTLVGSLTALAALSPTDVWSIGTAPAPRNFDPLIQRWDGQRWSPTPLDTDAGDSRYYRIFSIALVSPRDAWAVGTDIDVSWADHHDDHPLIEHWDGTRWSRMISPQPRDGHGYYLHAVTAVGSNDVWAVGSAVGGVRTLVEHWNGHSWRIVSSPSPGASNLQGVAALSPRDIWAVGSNSTEPVLIEHWDGRRWSVISNPYVPFDFNAPSRLLSIAAISSHDIWAGGNVGTEPLLVHWDGHVWKIVSGPTVYGVVTGLAAMSGREVWAVTGGVIEHWDGRRWSVVPNVPGGSPIALTVVAPHHIWIGANTPGHPVVQDFTSASCVTGGVHEESNIPLTVTPDLRVFDPATHHLFVATGHHEVTIVDTLKGAIATTVEVPSTLELSGSTASASDLYRDELDTLALNEFHGVVWAPDVGAVLDTRTGAVVGRSTEHHYDWILPTVRSTFAGNDKGIDVVEPTTGRVLATLAITQASAVADNATTRVFIVHDDETTVVDATSGMILRTIPGVSGWPAVDAQANRVAILPNEPYPRKIWLLDGISGAIRDTLQTDGWYNNLRLTDEAMHRIAVEAGAGLLQIDTFSGAPVGIANFSDPSAADPDWGAWWVAADAPAERIVTLSYYGHLRIIDSITGRVLHTVDTNCFVYGTEPAIDPQTQRIFVPCSDRASLAVIDAITGATVTVLPDTQVIAIDQEAGHMILAADNYNTYAMIDDRFPTVPQP